MTSVHLSPKPDSVFVYKKANQSSTDGTNLTDVTDMVWTMDANGIYVLDGRILKSAAAATTGLVLALNGPAAPVEVSFQVFGQRAATTTLALQAAAYETAMVGTDVPSTNFGYPDVLNGFIENGPNAGSLQLRFRTEVNASAATIHRGSWGRLTRVD